MPKKLVKLLAITMTCEIVWDISVEHYIPNFKNLNKKHKLNILLKGIETDDPEFFYLNKTLTIAVQNFIIETKRFVI